MSKKKFLICNIFLPSFIVICVILYHIKSNIPQRNDYSQNLHTLESYPTENQCLDLYSIPGISKTTVFDDQGNILILLIPSISYVEDYGYPENTIGETFGPDLKNSISNEPDLVLAQNKDGIVGYIRKSEIPDNTSTTEYNASVNLYLHDGIYIIGTFYINNCEVIIDE